MVDCRLCKNHFRIWGEELGEEPNDFIMVCCKFEMIVKRKDITEGPCDEYVDRDFS